MNGMIQIFTNKTKEIRVIAVEGEPWFVVSDICEYFSVTNRNRVMQALDDDEKGGTQMSTPGGMQNIAIVSEAGMYSLLFALQPTKARGVPDERIEARCAELKAFKRWITHEVIPDIRRQGLYASDETLSRMLGDPDQLIAILTRYSNEKNKRQLLEEKVRQDAPKVLFADSVEASHQTILIGELAKLMKQNGIEIGQNRLFQKLRDEGFLCGSGDRRNLPTQRAMEMKLFEVKERTINNPDGSVRLTLTTKVSGKGQIYFMNRYRGWAQQERM